MKIMLHGSYCACGCALRLLWASVSFFTEIGFFCRFQSVAYHTSRLLLPSLFVNEKIMNSWTPCSSGHWHVTAASSLRFSVTCSFHPLMISDNISSVFRRQSTCLIASYTDERLTARRILPYRIRYHNVCTYVVQYTLAY